MPKLSQELLKARTRSASLLKKPWTSNVPGVYFVAAGKPRWVARIRWRKDGQFDHLPLHAWPLTLIDGAFTERDLLKQKRNAEAWAEREWETLEKTNKERPYSLQPSSWTLGQLLEKYVEDIEAGTLHYRSCQSDRSIARTFLGLASRGPNVGNIGFRVVLGKTLDQLQPTDFNTTTPRNHPNALLVKFRGRIYTGKDGKTLYEPVPPQTQKRLMQAIRTVFAHAKREWGVDVGRDVVGPLPVVDGIHGREVTLTEEEFQQILSRMSDTTQSLRDLVFCNRHTAIRRGEACKLKWAQVTRDNRSCHLLNTKSRRIRGKDQNRERFVPFPDEVVEMIARRRELRREGEEYVFPSPTGGKFHVDSVTQAWRRARERAERDNPELKGKRLHDLRHTAITELGETMPAAMVAKISGHNDLTSFMRYFNPSVEALREQMNAAKRKQRMKDLLDQQRQEMGDTAPSVEHILKQLMTLSNDDFSRVMSEAIPRRFASAG